MQTAGKYRGSKGNVYNGQEFKDDEPKPGMGKEFP